MSKSSIAARQPTSSDQRHASDDLSDDTSTSREIEACADLAVRRRNLLLKQHLVLKFVLMNFRIFMPETTRLWIAELLSEYRAFERAERAQPAGAS